MSEGELRACIDDRGAIVYERAGRPARPRVVRPAKLEGEAMSDGFKGTEHYRERVKKDRVWIESLGYLTALEGQIADVLDEHADAGLALCQHIDDQEAEIEQLKDQNYEYLTAKNFAESTVEQQKNSKAKLRERVDELEGRSHERHMEEKD